MGHKHLHELLKEDQEPFVLKNYVADRRCQLKPNPQTTLNPRKRKPLIQFTSTRSFCFNHVCLFTLHDSPDVRKSPGIKSPNNAAVFLHIPSRTAGLLLDAAVRIQKQNYKPRTDSFRNVGFGLFGSLIKRLKDRKTRKVRREIRLFSPPTSRTPEIDDNNIISSADWSEKSWDFENSCSSLSVNDSEEINFSVSLDRSNSSGCRKPDFLSPATSPTHHPQQNKEDYEAEKPLEEEDIEQCSPVSVLDPLFEDDGEEHDDGGYDLERACTKVQREKHKLLQKLHRFEKLANLEPTKLAKNMSEQGDDLLEEEAAIKEIFKILDVGEIPAHMKNLVADLVVEESKMKMEHDVVVRRVLCRFESWKMVEPNTIDMMVELDFKEEKSEGWKRYDEQKIKETGIDIEVAIFGILTEELAHELVFS